VKSIVLKYLFILYIHFLKPKMKARAVPQKAKNLLVKSLFSKSFDCCSPSRKLLSRNCRLFLGLKEVLGGSPLNKGTEVLSVGFWKGVSHPVE